MKVYPIEHESVYNNFARYLRKERVAIKRSDVNTKYLALCNGVHPIGVVGWQQITEGHVRLKTDYLHPNWRGKKLYSYLFDSRFFLILDNYSPNVLTAYCTPMSLPKYLASGFEVQSTSDTGISYVKQHIR